MNRLISKVLCYGALFLFLMSVSFVAQAAEADKQNPLAGTEWELVSPEYKGLQKKPFLKFTDARISASVGLNALGGTYRVEGRNLKFEHLFSTQMAGPQPLMDAESRYSRALDGVRSFELSNDKKRLTLRGKQTLIFHLTRKNVAAPVESGKSNRLAWTEWELASPTYSGVEKTPFLKFTDTRINASVGLNMMGGGYKVEGDKIRFDRLISTRMAGPRPLMEAESRYAGALARASTFRVSSDGKTLTLIGDETLVFRLTGATSPEFVATETKLINVGSRLGPELDGDQTAKYLQLEDLSEGGGWGRFTEPEILGFDFVPGYRYQLRVQVERNMRSGEKRLRLLEVFAQQWMRSAQIKRGEEILEVAPAKVDCADTGEQQCLQVRSVGGEWRALHAPIEGFEFQEGWRYRLQIVAAPMKNLSVDGSNTHYVLVRLLDKMPVIY